MSNKYQTFIRHYQTILKKNKYLRIYNIRTDFHIVAYIYSITNNINQKQYVGLTRQSNPYNRWKKHLEDSRYNSQHPIHRAIRKYGSDNFKFRIIEECDESKLEEREIYYIKEFNTFYEGYNATLGGKIQYDGDAKPVTQYNKKGERIKDFASIRDAAESIGKELSAISRCANGERFSAYGYRWSWKGEKLPILKMSYLKPIYAYNSNKDYREWTCLSEASRELNYHHRSISNSINSSLYNKQQYKGWYFFKMEDGKVDFDEITFAKKYKPSKEKASEMGKLGMKKRWSKGDS